MRFILSVILVSMAGTVAARTPLLPPELSDKVSLWVDIADVDELPLWPTKKLGHFQNRYRLTISGIACGSYTFRVDERNDGRGIGVIKSWNHCKHDDLYSERDFSLTLEQMRDLKSAFEKAELWQLNPQFWQFKNTKDYICIDGEQMTFERRNTVDYRVSQANAQCEAPGTLVEAARKFVTLSGEQDALRLLN